MYTDINIIKPMPPLLIHLVLEGKLNITATDLSCVDKQQRDFLRRKRLLPDDIIYNCFRFIVRLCTEPLLSISVLDLGHHVDNTVDRQWRYSFVYYLGVAPILLVVDQIQK